MTSAAVDRAEAAVDSGVGEGKAGVTAPEAERAGEAAAKGDAGDEPVMIVSWKG